MCESKQNSINEKAYKRITLSVFSEVIYLSSFYLSTYPPSREIALYLLKEIFFLVTPCCKQDLFPNQKMNLLPLQWKQGELTPRPPGKSQKSL